MKIRTSLQILLLFIGLTTCQKEKIANRQYPRVKTLQVTEINESGAKFNAEIFSGNLQDIEEYGFIWNSGDKVVSREPIQNKSFSFTVHSALKKGTTYEVKAYVKTQTYEVFGPPVTFISLGSEAPVITDFDKKSGTWGDTITITGKNFRYKKEEVRVQLGDLYISVLSSTDTTIKIIVPFSFYSNSEKTNIRVTIEGNTATSTDQFTYLKPQITSIHPLLGTFNDTIEITGNNFSISRDTNVNKISFNGMAGEIVYATRSKLKVLVPVNLSSKVSNISIPGPLANTIFGNPFILKDMIISGFEPDTVFHLNDEITIKGQNFNPIPQNTSILLKGKLAQVIEASSNQLKVRFPSEIITNQSISMMDTAKITVKTQLQNINTSKALQIWYKSRWTKLRDFPGYNTVELPALGINDKGYVGCKEFWEYDPDQDQWSRKADFPDINRTQVSSFSLNGEFYMGLGKNGYNTYKDFYKYTPSLNTWTKIEDFPGTARYSAASFTKGNLAYVGTGRLQNEDADDFWSFNPQNNQWNQTINFTEKTSCAIGFSINSNSYVYNWNTSYLYNLFKKIRSYNGTSWTELANLQSVPYLGLVSSIFSINGKAYLFAEGVSLLEFDPITNQTTKLTIPNGMQWRNTVFVIGNKAYVIAVDQYGSSFKSVWEFDPSK